MNGSWRRAAVAFGLAGVVLGVAGCGASLSKVYESPRLADADLLNKPILIVPDVCVTRFLPDGKKEYVCLSDSRRACEKAATALRAFLCASGFPAPTEGPLGVGGFLAADAALDCAPYPSTLAAASKPPLWLDGAWANWRKDSAPSMERCLMQGTCREGASRPKGPTKATEGEEFRAAVRALGARYGCEYVLLVGARGRVVAKVQQIREALPGAIVTATLTLGTFSAAVMSANYLLTHAVLLDAKTGESIWENSYAFGGQQSDQVFLLYGNHFLCRKEEAGRANEALRDPGLQAWARMPWHAPWQGWAAQVLSPLVKAKQRKGK